MAITKLNSLAIPPNTVVESDISFPLDSASFTGDFTVDTDTLVVDATNNHVKIGDTAATPDGFLSIRSDSDAHAISIYEPAGANENWQIGVNASGDLQFYDSGSTAGSVTFQDGGNVGIGTTSPNGKLDITGSGNTDIYLNTGNNSGDNNRVFFGDTSDIDVGYLSYDHGTNTMSFGVNASEAMRIDSSGNVGIGTGSSVDTKLHVENSSGIASVKIESGGAGTQSNLYFQDANTTVDGSIRIGSAGNDFRFFTSSTERMRIDSSGNVGIGTTSPATKLDIQQNTGDVILRMKETGSGQVQIRAVDSGVSNEGNMAFHTESSGGTVERMRITSSGFLLVGCTAQPSSSVKGMGYGDLAASSGDTSLVLSGGSYTGGDRQISFVNGNGTVGSITTSGTGTSYSTSSDYRLKENVVALTGASDRLNQILVHRFNFIADPDTTVDGFLAHEVADVVPEAIFGTKDEVDDEGNPVYQCIDQSKLVPLLTAALQEAVTRIETLEAEVAALKGA